MKFDLSFLNFFAVRIKHFPPHLNNVLLLLTVKYSQLEQSANICDVSNQPIRIFYTWKNRSDNKQE